MSNVAPSKRIRLAVIVAALGYFVDIYDLVLFNVIRRASLADMGITQESDFIKEGLFLLNMQMGGMLLGGILWGVLADKRGRLSVLFGSILLYSIANIANGFVETLPQYAVLRFVAGLGLAGELGAGITLVSESMHKESRGYGTMIVAGVGILGGIVAALVGGQFQWRTAFFVGGGLGLILLVLRIGVYESGMFQQVKKQAVSRGNFFQLFSSAPRARRFISVILIGVPIWFTVAILIALSPEIGKAMGMVTPPSAGQAVMFCYIGLAIGDFSSGALSQIIKSRKKVLKGFLVLTALSIGVYFLIAGRSLFTFYAVCTALGFATGYWAVFVTVASEQFGTNLRGTATTSAPNLVRGSVVPVTMLFQALTPLFEAWRPRVGILWSAGAVGAITLVLAFVALRGIEETYGKDLDFLEE